MHRAKPPSNTMQSIKPQAANVLKPVKLAPNDQHMGERKHQKQIVVNGNKNHRPCGNKELAINKMTNVPSTNPAMKA